jgi:hypothetical protein
MTTTNLIDTNITSGSANITNATIATARITSNLLALGNSNTLGNLFTTGGNVGIGTTAPGYSLDISAPSVGIAQRIYSLNPHLYLQHPTAGSETSIRFATGTGADHYIGNNVGGCGTNNFGIYVNGSNRLTVSSTGNIGIGNNSANQKLIIGSTAAFFTASGSGDQFVVHANASSQAAGYFYYNSSNNYGTISDRRTKTDITPIDAQDALAFISNITPSDFVLNGQTERQSGFIAQNVLAAVQNDAQKSAVSKWETYDETDPECPLIGISDRPILSNLVAVVKYQQTEIDTLKATNASLLQFIQSKFPGEFSL